jgi:hypothetical protein
MRSKRSNDGEVSIETVMMMPVLLLLIFAALQISVAWFAKLNLEAAASDVLSEYQRSTVLNVDMNPSAVEIAKQSLRKHAGYAKRIAVLGPLGASAVDRVKFTVTAEVPGAFPGMVFKLSASASGPKEVFRPQGSTG